MTLASWQDLCVDAADTATVAAFWAPVLSVRQRRRPSLVEHGATVLREPDADIRWHVLADPAGNEFCVMAP